jgi:hypothetical protein
MTFFPFSSESDRDPRSDFTSVNSGALLPLTGRLPEVFTGFPLNVIFAILFFLKFTQSFSAAKVCKGHTGIWKKTVGLYNIQNLLKYEFFLPPGHQDTKAHKEIHLKTLVKLCALVP